MTDVVAPTGSRLTAVLRGDDERVTPLELFFDLVFVVAITQCTALMAHENSWEGLAKAEHVQIFIDEVCHENWAKGGKLAVDEA